MACMNVETTAIVTIVILVMPRPLLQLQFFNESFHIHGQLMSMSIKQSILKDTHLISDFVGHRRIQVEQHVNEFYYGFAYFRLAQP